MTESVSSTLFTADAFFAGVGGIELVFEQTGKLRVLYANEFDKNARKTYALNYPNVILDGRDIHEVNPNEIPGTFLWEDFHAKHLVLQDIGRASMMNVAIFF